MDQGQSNGQRAEGRTPSQVRIPSLIGASGLDNKDKNGRKEVSPIGYANSSTSSDQGNHMEKRLNPSFRGIRQSATKNICKEGAIHKVMKWRTRQESYKEALAGKAGYEGNKKGAMSLFLTLANLEI